MEMQTNFKKQEDDTLKTLIKDRDKTAEEIGYLLLQRDSINCDIADLHDRLGELFLFFSSICVFMLCYIYVVI